MVYEIGMETKLFLSDHVDRVYQFERERLSGELSEIEREMNSWQQPWRRESLEHYSQLGWSFISWRDEQVQGYLLAQPILFFNNWTQTLWIEHLSFSHDEVGQELVDVAVRWAKTKHLQKVIFNSQSESASFVSENFEKFKPGQYLHMSTTKLQEA